MHRIYAGFLIKEMFENGLNCFIPGLSFVKSEILLASFSISPVNSRFRTSRSLTIPSISVESNASAFLRLLKIPTISSTNPEGFFRPSSSS